MYGPSKHGKSGHSFDSETSVFTTPPRSPPRASRSADSQLVRYHGGGAHYGANGAHEPQARPTYYVQSPSRDSFTFNEVDSLSQSFAAKSSPPGSPLASPLHKSFASKPHQYEASPTASYYSNPRPGSRRVLPQPNNVNANVGGGGGATTVSVSHKKGYQPWNGGTIQEEEEQLPLGSTGRRGFSRWCAFFLSLFAGALCIVIVGLIYWLVCRPSAPRVEVKSINFQTFSIDEGNDATGVPTQVLSIDVTTSLSYGNPSKYFGFHVSSPEVTLSYEEIVVAQGQTDKFYQKKKSASSISVDVRATRNPVYGAGPNLLSTFDDGAGLPLQMHIRVQSEALVIWRIVRPKYRSHIACDLVLNSNSNLGSIKIVSQNCHRG